MSKTIVTTIVLVAGALGALLYWNAQQRGTDALPAIASDPEKRASAQTVDRDDVRDVAAPVAQREGVARIAAPRAEPTLAPAASTTPIADPVPVIAAVGRLLENNQQLGPGMQIPGLHRQLAGETKDLEWASQMEYEMRRFMDARAAAQEFTIDLIECRATLCEIQTTAANVSLQAKWSELLAQMRREPWAAGIAGTIHAGIEDNTANTLGIVTIVRRKT